jgi:hypothetical protein
MPETTRITKEFSSIPPGRCIYRAWENAKWLNTLIAYRQAGSHWMCCRPMKTRADRIGRRGFRKAHQCSFRVPDAWKTLHEMMETQR